MSDSTQNLDQVSATAVQRETTINALLDAASPATLYGRRASTTTALTWGYYGGRYGGTSVANGTVALTASNTNYVVVNRSTGAVSVSTATTNWDSTSTYGRAYKIVAGASTVTSYEDHRSGPYGILQPAPVTAAMVILAPAYAASVTVDLTSYTAYPIVVVNVGTLTGDITFNISNGADGQMIRCRFKQDGTGSRLLTAGANLRGSTDTAIPALSTAAGTLDRMAFEWHAGDGKADLVAYNKGY